jgi:hypothetical protein
VPFGWFGTCCECCSSTCDFCLTPNEVPSVTTSDRGMTEPEAEEWGGTPEEVRRPEGMEGCYR